MSSTPDELVRIIFPLYMNSPATEYTDQISRQKRYRVSPMMVQPAIKIYQRPDKVIYYTENKFTDTGYGLWPYKLWQDCCFDLGVEFVERGDDKFFPVVTMFESRRTDLPPEKELKCQ